MDIYSKNVTVKYIFNAIYGSCVCFILKNKKSIPERMFIKLHNYSKVKHIFNHLFLFLFTASFHMARLRRLWAGHDCFLR